MKLLKPINGEKIILHTKEQQEYLSKDRSEITVDTFDYLNLVRREGDDYSLPKEVTFEWEADGEVELQVSENSDFNDVISKKATNFCNMDSFKCNTRYFWRVVSGDEASDVFYFDTADVLPRIVRVDGVSNVRDCGGWKTRSGRRIKQGLLYRGGELDGHMNITDEGRRMMKEVLKIKSILDIRQDFEVSGNVYGENYIHIPTSTYFRILEQKEEFKKVFEFLADENNYPIYYHCWGGADRTGSIATLIGYLLGMEMEDMIDDYEITSLSIWGARSRNSEGISKLYAELNALEGETREEKAKSFLLSCSLSEETIERFREIMLE